MVRPYNRKQERKSKRVCVCVHKVSSFTTGEQNVILVQFEALQLLQNLRVASAYIYTPHLKRTINCRPFERRMQSMCRYNHT